ncbi:histidine kinase [Corynebacterium silvaticum]|nr:histidine kinase [Corynebacterium silvaticum]TFA95550.1 histidine kinase [Corynebacterium silvaticum]TNX84721.1 histidine kinase [Corynebacterium silvaticum]TRM15303.1 histidine kinase [Corynebacterium silvaticum]
MCRLFKMSESDKFSIYVRGSMHICLVILAVFCMKTAIWWNSLNQYLSSFDLGSLPPALFFIANVSCAAVVIERTPALRTSVARPLSQVLPLSLAINIITLCISTAAIRITAISQSLSDDSLRTYAGVSLVALSCFSFAIAINLAQPMRYTLVFGVLTAVYIKHPTFEHQSYIVVFALVLVAGSKATAWSTQIVKQLNRTRELESQLRVHEERLRFAQELHDSLGQRIAALSLKTQIALALYKKDEHKVSAELHELEKLIQLMREDLHQVVTGYRTLCPEEELNSALSLFKSTKALVHVRGKCSLIPPHCRQIAA